MISIRATVLLTAALVWPFASPSPEGWTRRGNVALRGGDAAAALGSYARAEDRTTDPGLVAYNQALALYRLGDYRAAELHFRRCQSDADGQRLARLLLGLGNALVRRSQGQDAELLDQAIECYEESLRQEPIEATVAEDAQHNLELARLLRKDAPEPGKRAERPLDEAGKPNARPDAKREPRSEKQTPRSAADPTGGPATPTGDAVDPRHRPLTSEQAPPPGKGNLPPIPDSTDQALLSPEDAAAHLRFAVTRIVRERQEHHRKLLANTPRSVPDW